MASFHMVSKDHFIYFLGGYAHGKVLTDGDKYDLRTNTWDKTATLQEPRQNAYDAAMLLMK